MGLLRSLVTLVGVAAFVYFGTTVNLGRRTLFGHFSNIWQSDQAKELADDLEKTSGPVVDRLKRGVEAGVKEASKATGRDAGVGVDAEQE